MSMIIEMRVHMDCNGCQEKVKSALQKLKGVDGIDIDMNLQKVTVTGWAEQKKVLKTVRKTGRRAELWQLPYNPAEFENYYQQHHSNGPIMTQHHVPQPSSFYNYYKHGYDILDRSYYHNPAGSCNIFGYQTGAAFSDENPNACSVM